MKFGVVRFNEMKKYIGQISYKTLSSTLKELEADQLVQRISTDSAQGRVQHDRKRQISDPDPGRNV